MVYCGKPSAGCAVCRKKKTRCDRAIPSCGQCIRANRTCSGYRNQLDLMFRSQNEAVIGKVKVGGESSKACSRSTSPSSPTSTATTFAPSEILSNALAIRPNVWVQDLDRGRRESGVSVSENAEYQRDYDLLVFGLSPTLSERAQCYFSSNSRSWLRNYDLVDELCRYGDAHDPVLASITALGLASYASTVNGPQLLNRARSDYVKALRLTNAALRSPTEVRKDSTLFSVMILSIFEMVAGSNERSLEAWTEHIKGASTLLQLRGTGQFRTRAGQQLFVLVTSNLMVSCVQRTIPIPEHIIELRQIAREVTDSTIMPVWQVSDVIIEFANFRAAVRDYQIIGPRAVIKAALEVDRKFVEVFHDFPEAWKYHSVYKDEDEEGVWNRRYDVYNNYQAAQTWNNMRCCRILIHEIVREQLLAASTAMDPVFTVQESREQHAQTVHVLLKMQADILATIPQHIPSNLNSRPASLMDGSRGYSVLWPLYTAGVMDLATLPVKTWVIGKLRVIADQVGIRQATVLADIMETNRHVVAWQTKPAPRMRSDGTFFGRKPASRLGTLSPDWWDVDPPEEVSDEMLRKWELSTA